MMIDVGKKSLYYVNYRKTTIYLSCCQTHPGDFEFFEIA